MNALCIKVVIENLEDIVTLTWDDFSRLVEANASVVGFRFCQTVTYRNLLYGLLLASGADAVQALTKTVAGGKSNFVQRKLNLGNTHFMNEIGLDEDRHCSTVEEVAKLFQYDLKKQEFQRDYYSFFLYYE